MSLLGKPSAGGGGSGLTPEQLDALVTDPELSASQAGAYQLLSLLLHGQVVSDPNNFATYTPTAAQVSNVDVKVNEVAGAVSNLAAAAVPSGLTVLINRADGQAPAGYTRVSGLVSPFGVYSAQRFTLTNLTVTPQATSENKAWFIATSGTGTVWDIGTGVNTSIAAWTGNTSWPPGVVLATDEQAFTFGANSSANGPNSQAFRFTLSTNSWTQIANLPGSRNYPLGAQQADGRMLIIGGSTGLNLTTAAALTDTVYRYDPSANTYVSAASLPFRAGAGYSTRLADGRIFAIWSNTSDGTNLTGNKAAIYSPASNTWETLDNPAYAGPCYQDANGNIVVLSLATPGNAQTYNASLPAGSRWTSTPYTAPNNLASLSVAPSFGFNRPLVGAGIPFVLTPTSGGTLRGLFAIGALTQASGNAFYAIKN